MIFWENRKVEYGEALTAISSSDMADKSGVIAAVKKQHAMLIDEKRAVVEKAGILEEAIAAISEGVGASGENAAEKLKSAADKVRALTASVTASEQRVAALTADNAKLVADQSALSGRAMMQDLASKTGGNRTVLAKLIDPASVTIDGDTVKIGNKTWEDWLNGEEIKPFIPALGLPIDKPAGVQLPSLPSGKAADGPAPAASIYDRISPKRPQVGNQRG